ncbi:helix-turn-helix domain-containing protein [Staphylococcus hominis]|uniref:helix-turn-helix domain-containing protein n=1 Tax=Staphylococcus hominis TaxID=1290 RepID=UPI000E018ED5|nr:helix-turn-helix transcriptional regulator [Staphylococcus hominis]SUM70177.1 mobile element-associated transcriptional regulator, putative [Staphylococcus hominis]
MIRNRLSELLSERGLKTSRVAKDVKIARSSLTSMIQNDAEMVRYDAIDKLCRYLNISVNDFFEYVPINIEITIENIDSLITFNDVEDLRDLSKIIFYLYVNADFLIDIEFNNKNYTYDCELSLDEIKYNTFFNEFIFVLKEEDEHSDLKEKIDNLTPGLKKILFKRINNLLNEKFVELLLDKTDNEESFFNFSYPEQMVIKEEIRTSKFAIKSNIFTEY